jgi:plasmid stabilization system protein ParE
MQLPCGRHTIFYMKAVSGIIIVRVLHERMDFSRHH